MVFRALTPYDKPAITLHYKPCITFLGILINTFVNREGRKRDGVKD